MIKLDGSFNFLLLSCPAKRPGTGRYPWFILQMLLFSQVLRFLWSLIAEDVLVFTALFIISFQLAFVESPWCAHCCFANIFSVVKLSSLFLIREHGKYELRNNTVIVRLYSF